MIKFFPQRYQYPFLFRLESAVADAYIISLRIKKNNARTWAEICSHYWLIEKLLICLS